MNKLFIFLYSIVPKSIKQYFGKKSWLQVFRDAVLKKEGIYREVDGIIQRRYQNNQVKFIFFGSIQNVAKAQNTGVENTLLNNSIKLINTYIEHDNDCVILDIGSNFGFLSLVWASSICKNNGRVFSFEPNFNVYSSFEKSINENNLNNVIVVNNMAVGSKNGTIDIYLNNTTSNIISNNEANKSVEIEMIAIDSYIEQNNIKRCDLIKIDVDGIEHDILKGSINTLSHFKPICIVETNNDKRILDFFKKNEYRILDMELKEYVSDNEIPPNIFCLPNNKDNAL